MKKRQRGSYKVIAQGNRQLYMLIFMVLALPLAGWYLYDSGRQQGGYYSAVAKEKVNVLLNRVAGLEIQLQESDDSLILMRKNNEVDRLSHDQVKVSVQEQQSEILELKQEVVFYRGIVSPSNSAKGLALQSVNIEIAENEQEKQRFRFTVVLIQVLENRNYISGKVDIRIKGIENESVRLLPLSDLLIDKKENLRFRFRYFQRLHGEIRLPPGFIAEDFIVTVTPRKKGGVQFEKTYNWNEIVR